jgi:hypothetical protein
MDRAMLLNPFPMAHGGDSRTSQLSPGFLVGSSPLAEELCQLLPAAITDSRNEIVEH